MSRILIFTGIIILIAGLIFAFVEKTNFKNPWQMIKTKNFDYPLPKELIAKYPKSRGKSRMLYLNRKTGDYADRMFEDLPDIIDYPCVIVRNTSRVVKTRFYAKRESGANVEVLIIDPFERGNVHKAIMNRTKRMKINEKLILSKNSFMKILSKKENIFEIEIVSDKSMDDFYKCFGHVPLPGYIKRPDEKNDERKYQTVYSKTNGSCAAPTAGFHFTKKIINKLEERGTVFADIVLHIGLGTFEPVKTENVKQHKMHSEYYTVSKETTDILNSAKSKGIPIISIGTTSLRVLESIYNKKENKFLPHSGYTDIFIYPPYKIETINMLLTNFHLPCSTLIMLVSAFAGFDNIMKAYKHAVKEKYRFYSYGDCMLMGDLCLN